MSGDKEETSFLLSQQMSMVATSVAEKMTDLDSFTICEKESHALEKNIKEKCWVAKKSKDKCWVCLSRSEDTGQLFCKLFMHSVLVSTFHNDWWAEDVLEK